MRKKIAARSRPTTAPKRLGAIWLLAGTLVMGFMPAPARAGLTITCSPTYSQSAVLVGDVLTTATLLINNASDGPQGMLPISVSNIRQTPACGDAGAGATAVQSCDAAEQDPDVFTLAATATGIAPPGPNGAPVTATACNGRTFTISVIDTDTGEVRLTPDMPIVLQPSGLPGSGCLIQFSSIVVANLPTHDVNPDILGAMTNQLCRVTATQQTLTVTNGGLGQIVASELPPDVRTTPAVSDQSLVLAALALVVSGAFILRRRKQFA